MTIFYRDDAVTLHHGDSLQVLQSLPDESVNCCVTSPPYYGLRDYGNEGQYGLEPTPAAYVETMRALFAEVRRVLAKDGTLWLNLGDSYAPTKNLLGIPWRVAFALQDDGWILRNAIVWAKPNAMPEPVTDRLSTKHELIFMFSRSRKYWFDLDPIREAHTREGANVGGQPSLRAVAVGPMDRGGKSQFERTAEQRNSTAFHPAGRNPGDVWEIPTTPFPGAHFAVFPQEIPRRAILAGCKPGGTVLDPFSGSGTTGLVAGQIGRKYVGIDLSAEYLSMSLKTRLRQMSLVDELELEA